MVPDRPTMSPIELFWTAKNWSHFVFPLRFGKPDPRNAALVSAMAVIGKAFKRLHRQLFMSEPFKIMMNHDFTSQFFLSESTSSPTSLTSFSQSVFFPQIQGKCNKTDQNMDSWKNEYGYVYEYHLISAMRHLLQLNAGKCKKTNQKMGSCSKWKC